MKRTAIDTFPLLFRFLTHICLIVAIILLVAAFMRQVNAYASRRMEHLEKRLEMKRQKSISHFVYACKELPDFGQRGWTYWLEENCQLIRATRGD